MIKEIWGYFKGFIGSKINEMILNGLVLIMFSLVLYFYNVEVDAVIYGLVISLFVTLIFYGFEFYKYFKRLKGVELCCQSDLFIEDNLPKTGDKVEKTYQDLIMRMNQTNQNLKTTYDQKQSEMKDYYTLWTHQIKTPIAASKLLISEGEGSRQLLLKQELQKIENYVESALYYAKLDSINQDFDFAKVDVQGLVKEVARKYASIFIYKKIGLNLGVMNIQVISDKKWLLFVIDQLVSNALKYTKSGSISIHYNEENASLTIEDTGIGIKEEDISRVFNKGFTGVNGRMDKSSTGIGLYLCDVIIGKLGHEIKLESKVDVGAKVCIYFGS